MSEVAKKKDNKSDCTFCVSVNYVNFLSNITIKNITAFLVIRERPLLQRTAFFAKGNEKRYGGNLYVI